jgi:hypothetical protein
MRNDPTDWKRRLVSGVWGFFLIAAGATFSDSGPTFLLLGIPLLGLPWLLFNLNDRSANNEKTDAQHAIGVLLGGAIFTLIYTIPLILLWLLLKNLKYLS